MMVAMMVKITMIPGEKMTVMITVMMFRPRAGLVERRRRRWSPESSPMTTSISLHSQYHSTAHDVSFKSIYFYQKAKVRPVGSLGPLGLSNVPYLSL